MTTQSATLVTDSAAASPAAPVRLTHLPAPGEGHWSNGLFVLPYFLVYLLLLVLPLIYG